MKNTSSPPLADGVRSTRCGRASVVCGQPARGRSGGFADEFPGDLCRNAFIYFSAAAVRKTVDIFASRMPRPGYLCVGASESLLNITTAFSLQEIDGAFVYAKQ